MDTQRVVAGRYRLDQRIGSGAMGVVWRATDLLLERTVALKELRDSADRAGRERIVKEARTAATVRHHEHVVALYDVVDDDEGHPWLVMDHIGFPEPGSGAGSRLVSPTLAELIADGPLPPRRAARIGAQIAEALAEAHRLRVVHRDVKPHNVFFRRIEGAGARDHALVGDFGIARHADATITGGGVTGTPAYMSPEVAGFGEATPASDVFALGCTVYAAITGSPPFGTHGPPLAVMARVQACEVVVPPAAGPLRAVLEQLLRKEPADRPTAQEAARLLWTVADDAPPPPPGPRPGARRARRVRAVVGGGVLIVLLMAGVVIRGTQRDDGDVAGAAALPPVAALAAPAPAADLALPADIAVADPCGLADPAALRAFGNGRIETDWGFYSRCDVRVQPAAGRPMDVEIEFTGPPAQWDRLDPVEDVGVGTLSRGRDDGEACPRTLRLPDGNGLDVIGKHGGPGADRCGLADAAARHAIDVLGRDGVPLRSGPLPHSLARQDACVLAEGPALARTPGLDPAAGKRGFAGWRCDWRGDAQGYGAKIVFDRDGPFAAENGAITTIVGREAQVQPSGFTDQGCAVKIRNRAQGAGLGEAVDEVLIVDVSGPPPPEQLCRTATELAVHVAERIPPA